jgi:hypothetical protein
MERHLNGRKQIPLDDWKREFSQVSNKHAALLSESDKLSAELRSAATIKRNAEKVMGVVPEPRKTKSYDRGM